MTPVGAAESEACPLLEGVGWDAYVRLNDDIESLTHESVNRLMSDLFSNLAEGFDIDFTNAGSTTHRNPKASAGFEPGTCFYLDGRNDPDAPDLIAEVEVSRSSLDKLAAYSATGVREAWRYRNGKIAIFSLIDGKVGESGTSAILPGVAAIDLDTLLAKAGAMPRIKWAPFVRNWARARYQS